MTEYERYQAALAPKVPQRVEPNPIKGEFTTSGTRLGRGKRIKTRGGAVGLYVGTTDCGHEWVCYDDAEFAEMCILFDEREGLEDENAEPTDEEWEAMGGCDNPTEDDGTDDPAPHGHVGY